MGIFVVFWQEEEETELAVICLQQLLRGRAIQNMVFCVSLFMCPFRVMEGMIESMFAIFLPQH